METTANTIRPGPTERRDRFRTSVRALLLFVLIVGGGLGWIVHRARVQRDAVATIHKAGGSVTYDERWAPIPRPRRPPPSAILNWFRRKLGPDYFDTVTSVSLHAATCDDGALRAACRLPAIEELNVLQTSITDSGMEDLGNLRNLRALDLRLNHITPRSLRVIGELTELRELKLAMRLSSVPLRDEDLTFLKRLKKLEDLQLPSKTITGSWLVYIKGLTNLKYLQLYDNAITTADLGHLRGLTNLEVFTLHGSQVESLEPLRPLTKLTSLGLAYTPIRDSALPFLKNFPALSMLDLRKTRITNSGLGTLAELPTLADLVLSETAITDAGMPAMARSKSLRQLNLQNTDVTAAGVAEFINMNNITSIGWKTKPAGRAVSPAGQVKNQAR